MPTVKDIEKVQNIEKLPTFDSWAIIDRFWKIVKEDFASYDDAIDAFEDEDGYANKDIELAYVLDDPNDKDNYFTEPAPLIY